jgi:methionyl-tRNA formyltransferase
VARLTVAASAPFGADVLERLAAKHEIALLLTRPDKPRGRGLSVQPTPAKLVAQKLGIAVAEPARLDEATDVPTRTVVVVAYGLLIPEPLLSRALWLNVHPSLLPRWRGAAPVERALMAGDARTGVTIHRTTAELDAGPIAAQESFDLTDEDDAGAVFARCAELSVRLLDGVLSEPEPHFEPQPASGVTYAEKIVREDRELDLTRPARELVDVVRALSPHIGARAELDGRRLLVWRARVGADGSFEPLEVQPEGGRRMSYDAYVRGRR